MKRGATNEQSCRAESFRDRRTTREFLAEVQHHVEFKRRWRFGVRIQIRNHYEPFAVRVHADISATAREVENRSQWLPVEWGVERREYAHPATGYGATATQVFQAKLEEHFDQETGMIELPFSTFRDNGLTFFRGPRRMPGDPETLISRGQFLDKIYWMKVNLVGDFDGAPYDRVGGTLTYSGTAYLRNARVGVIPDQTRPDIIIDEFSEWPFRFWFYDSGAPRADPPVTAAWRSSNEQTTEIVMYLSDVSQYEVPDSAFQIDVFRERSVAADGWVLRIFTYRDGVPVIDIDDIDDIEILFYHVSKDRPQFSKANESGLE